MNRISSDHLRRLRNQINICEVINQLDIPSKKYEGFFHFLCPLCKEFNTAVNPKTNLARCFQCKQNFNPIDLVIAIRDCKFLDAVNFLEELNSLKHR